MPRKHEKKPKQLSIGDCRVTLESLSDYSLSFQVTGPYNSIERFKKSLLRHLDMYKKIHTNIWREIL